MFSTIHDSDDIFKTVSILQLHTVTSCIALLSTYCGMHWVGSPEKKELVYIRPVSSRAAVVFL